MIKLKNILKESKRLNLFEQALPEISFQDNFANNFTTVTGNWKASADSIVSQIQKEINQGKSLQSLAVNVSGGASKLSATNRYRGNTPPDHDFGGDPDFPGWVTFKLPNGKDRPLGEYPDGYKLIPKGNEFLAKTRAENLKKLLVPYISNKIGEKFDNINVIADPVDSDSTKYARATVTSAVKPFTEQYPHVIMYPWYSIGKVNNLVLVDVGPAAYQRNSTGKLSSNWAAAAKADKNVIYSGFQLIAKNPRAAYKGILPGCFIKLNADSYNGMFAFYNKYEDWLKDVQKMTQYASNDTQGGKLRFGGSTSNQTVKGITGAEGYVDTSGKSKYKAFAKFNMGSKDYIFTTNKVFL